MNVSELVVQAQLKLEDGTVITITTPPLTPEDLTVDRVKDVLMSLGETPEQKYQSQQRPSIVKASSSLKPFRCE